MFIILKWSSRSSKALSVFTQSDISIRYIPLPLELKKLDGGRELWAQLSPQSDVVSLGWKKDGRM